MYQIEVGGSSYTGMFGYLTAFQELIEQVNLSLVQASLSDGGLDAQ